MPIEVNTNANQIANIGVSTTSEETPVINISVPSAVATSIGTTVLLGPKGDKGDKGDTGAKGDKGDTGDTGATGNGISSITKTSTVGLVDTYTINYTDTTTTTYNVTNGEDGTDGEDGFSPSASVSKSGTVATITITDKTGTTTAQVYDGQGSITDVQKNGVSVVSGGIANVIVPTKTSDITNDSGFIDNTYHDSTKQDTLVSGTNIKTINNTSILGSGDITIQSAPPLDNATINQNASNQLQAIGTINSRDNSTALKTWTGTKAQYDAIATKDANTLYNITDDTDITLALLQTIYPVGALYFGNMATCPLAPLFGTWQLVATDRVIQGAGSRGSVGTTVNESLPNIKGSITRAGDTGLLHFNAVQSGALSRGDATYSYETSASSGTGYNLFFNASHSSSTYQDNAPVQQNAYLVNIWERIA